MDLEHAIGFDSKASNSLHVHPDGSSVIYVLGGCVVISQLKDAHNQVFLRGHNDQVTCVDLTKDGSLLASGQDGEQADVIVWEYTEGVDGGLPQCTEKYRLQEHDVGIAFCYFTHCGRFLLTVGKDKKLVVWDMHSGCIVARYKVSNMPLSACWGGRALDTKGRLTATFQLATGGEGKLTYWILDPAAGSLTPEDCSLGNQVRNFTALAFSPDATYLFAGSSSSDFTAVHVKHKVLHSTTVVGSNGVHVLICRRTDNGDRLIIGCGDGSITVLEGERNGADTCRMYSKGPPLQCSLMLDGPVRAMQLHGDVDESGFMRVLAVSGHGTLYACEMSAVDYRASQAPPAKSRVLQESHYAPVMAVAYPADSSETFATVSCDGTIRVWDVNTYGVNATGRIQTRICGMPKCLDFTGDVVFTGWEDGQIRAHEAETGEMLWAIKDAHRDGCTALAVSHNHKFLVSGGELGEVRVWEIRTREMVVNMKQHTSTVTSIKLFPDDAYVYSSSRDRTILQWDLRAEARKASMTQLMGGINALALIPGTPNLVSVGQEKRVSMWDNRESTPLSSVDSPQGAPPMGEQTCVSLMVPAAAQGNPAYAIFATAGQGDCRIRLWRRDARDPSRPQLMLMGDGHSKPVRAVQFSPDGKQLVSVGDDGAVLVWNIFVEDFFPELSPEPAAGPPQ